MRTTTCNKDCRLLNAFNDLIDEELAKRPGAAGNQIDSVISPRQFLGSWSLAFRPCLYPPLRIAIPDPRVFQMSAVFVQALYKALDSLRWIKLNKLSEDFRVFPLSGSQHAREATE